MITFLPPMPQAAKNTPVPYLKHSYIYVQVNKDAATDFYTCEGGNLEWQLLVGDHELAVEYLADEEVLTTEQAEQYAYVTSLMNDVHMSHSMEFPYPQCNVPRRQTRGSTDRGEI
ncbi:MAG: hypothetical protein GY832_14610 [Chloroflexi bacterium]|nr:hypothetical protein [Chloroflexota bacterium]